MVNRRRRMLLFREVSTCCGGKCPENHNKNSTFDWPFLLNSQIPKCSTVLSSFLYSWGSLTRKRRRRGEHRALKMHFILHSRTANSNVIIYHLFWSWSWWHSVYCLFCKLMKNVNYDFPKPNNMHSNAFVYLTHNPQRIAGISECNA